jgi:hypothetical protein
MEVAFDDFDQAVIPVGCIELGENGQVMVPLDIIEAPGGSLAPEHLVDIEETLRADKEAATNLYPLRLALVEDHDQLQVVDGTYRLMALQKLGANTVRASVSTMSMEEVIDRRMYNTAVHNYPSIARLFELGQTAWQQTAWANKINLNQALVLRSTRSSGDRLPIDASQVEEIKQWISQKTEIWGVSPEALARIGRLAQKTSPELLRQARQNKHSTAQYCFSLTHLEAITKAFPNQFGRQERLAIAAQQHQLTSRQISILIRRLEENPETSVGEQADLICRQEHQQKIVFPRRPDRVGRLAVEEAHLPLPETELPSWPSDHGFTEFTQEAWRNHCQTLLPVSNQDQLNQLSTEYAKKLGIRLNSLDINADGRAFFNKTIRITPGIETEVVSDLLAGYLLPPPSLDEFYTQFQIGLTVRPGYEASHKIGIHKVLMNLALNGIDFYNPETQQGAGLQLLIINDKRRR